MVYLADLQDFAILCKEYLVTFSVTGQAIHRPNGVYTRAHTDEEY